MATNETPLSATLKMREDFLKVAARYGSQLQAARSRGDNQDIAVFKGGGLALILENGAYRFGSVGDDRVRYCNETTVAIWNRQHPEHHVELVPLQVALERECASVCIMLHVIESRRLALESSL